MMHEIGSYEDKGVRVTMVANDEDALTHLYTQAVNRLMGGLGANADEAIKQLKAYKPKKVQAVIDGLMKDYTPNGIKSFETSLRKGFKAIGFWNN